MRLLLAAALALASTSGLGQDAPAAAVAIADLHAAAARKLKNDDCRTFGAGLCGFQHQGNATLEWSASCREAAQKRNLGRNYQGDAGLVGKYKDAVKFWDAYCDGHSEYEAVEDTLRRMPAMKPQVANEAGEAEEIKAALREGALQGRFLAHFMQCALDNPAIVYTAEALDSIEDETERMGATLALIAEICPEQTQAIAEVLAERFMKEKPPKP